LSDAGLAVFADCTDIIDRLSQMTERVLEGGVRSRFVISTLPSVGVRWLNARLAEFLARAPDVRCEFRIEDDPVDFAGHHIDLRICYGHYLYPELVSVPILHDRVTPLCTPKFLGEHGRAGDDPRSLDDGDLIHIDWGARFATYPTWADWFRAAGIDRVPQVDRGHTTVLSSLAIDLALSGRGVALGQCMLAREELNDGRLVAPFALTLPLGHAYCAVHPHSRLDNRNVRSFLDSIVRT
jgi:LysR family glycine cleavage system transcriptional activator